MRALVDTCAFLWMLTNSGNISPKARSVLADPDNELFFSAASGWEMAIKVRLGRLVLEGDIERLIPEQMHKLSIHPLPVVHAHALRTASLKPHHRDPFDRLLIAQAQIENLPIVTPDFVFRKYGIALIW